MSDHTAEPMASGERLHYAWLRLFVLVLYRPILRPTLRWLTRLLERAWPSTPKGTP